MKKVLVTGGHGFLGRHVVDELYNQYDYTVVSPRHTDYDLRKYEHVELMLMRYEPEVVIHLAARVGGIGLNNEIPATLLYDNAIMGLNVMEAARTYGVEKFVQVGTVCSYPKFTSVPFKETDIWNGYPEETNAPYGIAKKMLLSMSQAYRQQYGFNSIYLIPTNLYGPYDNFRPSSSHVIPALILKFDQAIRNGLSEVVIWGTGNATRDFLYVEDAAKAIVLATGRYNGAEPVNLGTGREVSISELATKISALMGFKGLIKFDATKPNGQPRRCLDVIRAKDCFDFEADTLLEAGLSRTIEWYKGNKKYKKTRFPEGSEL